MLGRRLSAIFGAALALALPGLASALARDEQAADTYPGLIEVAKVGRDSALVPVLNLELALADIRRGRTTDVTDLDNKADAAYTGLKTFKESIQSFASKFSDRDPNFEKFNTLVTTYLQLKSVLHLATEALGERGMRSVLLGNMPDLDLYVPSAVGAKICDIEGSYSAGQAGGTWYNHSIIAVDAGKGLTRLESSANEYFQLRTDALIKTPDGYMAKKNLETRAFQIIFAQQAALKQYLYEDERVDAPLPANADPVLLTMKSHAEAMVDESTFRTRLGVHAVAPIYNAFVKGRKRFALGVTRLFVDVSKRFEKYIDPKLNFETKYKRVVAEFSKEFQKQETELGAEDLALQLANTSWYIAGFPLTKIRELVIQKARESLATLVEGAIEGGMFEQAKLTDSERRALSALVLSFTTAQIDPNALTDSALEKVRQIPIEEPGMVSFRRYQLAIQSIAEAENLDRLLKRMAAVSKLDERFKKVPESLLPDQPEIPKVLVAAKGIDQEIPAWILEIIEQGSRKFEESEKAAAAPKNPASIMAEAMGKGPTGPDEVRGEILNLLTNFPTEALALTQRMQSVSSASALRDLRAAHRSLLGRVDYQWAPIPARLAMLSRSVSTSAAREIVLGLLKIIAQGTETGAASLKDSAVRAVKSLLGSDDVSLGTTIEDAAAKQEAHPVLDWLSDRLGSLVKDDAAPWNLDDLISALKTGRDFVLREKTFLQLCLGRPSDRKAFLKRAISDRQAYSTYMMLELQQFQAQSPILFAEVPLPKTSKEGTNNDTPIPFGKLIMKVKEQVNEGFLTHAFSQVKREEVVKDWSKLNQQIKGTLPLSVTTEYVGSTVRREEEELDSKVFAQVAKWAFENTSGKDNKIPLEDKFWPTALRVRDVFPTKYDGKTPMETRARRMIVAALLSPYIRTAAASLRDQQKRLLDSREDHTAMFYRNEPFRDLMGSVGPILGGGLERLKNEKLFWENARHAAKAVTTKLQEGAGEVFNFTFWCDPPPGIHVVAGWYMLGASLLDYVADAFLLYDYWQTYADIRPFSYGGLLSRGIVSPGEVAEAKHGMESQAVILADRTLMDWAWYVSAFKNAAMMKQMKKQYEALGQTAERKISLSYTVLGIKPGTPTEAAKAAREKKVSEIPVTLRTPENAAALKMRMDGLDAALEIVTSVNEHGPEVTKSIIMQGLHEMELGIYQQPVAKDAEEKQTLTLTVEQIKGFVESAKRRIQLSYTFLGLDPGAATADAEAAAAKKRGEMPEDYKNIPDRTEEDVIKDWNTRVNNALLIIKSVNRDGHDSAVSSLATQLFEARKPQSPTEPPPPPAPKPPRRSFGPQNN